MKSSPNQRNEQLKLLRNTNLNFTNFKKELPSVFIYLKLQLYCHSLVYFDLYLKLLPRKKLKLYYRINFRTSTWKTPNISRNSRKRRRWRFRRWRNWRWPLTRIILQWFCNTLFPLRNIILFLYGSIITPVLVSTNSK